MGICNLGKREVAALTLNIGSPVAFSYLGIGTGTTAFAATQMALVTPLGDRASSTVTLVTTTVTDDTTQYAYSFSITGTNTITEVAIFNASSSGVMLARTVLTTPRAVVNGDTYALTYKVSFA